MQTRTLTTVNTNTGIGGHRVASTIARRCQRVSASGRTLWSVQALLAGLFLFAGVMKLVTPAATLEEQAEPFSVSFMRFVGLCEALGGAGLVLPWLLKVRHELTPVAGAGLIIIMVGATVSTAVTANPAAAVIPFAVGLLCAFVATSRARQLAGGDRTRTGIAQPAS